jgi:S1-C subfamily serine protease
MTGAGRLTSSLPTPDSLSRVRSPLLRRLCLAAAALAAAFVGFAPRAGGASFETGVVDVVTNLAYQNGSAAGTGMVLSASGEVLTNNHVIRGASTIRVIDPSTGRRYSATVLGYSVANDIAVLKLKGAAHLHTVALGNSSTVRVGQPVTAVGNAGGAGGTPASARGKVTGVGRTITVSDDGITERLTGLIRTDAALEPGDSGGPLLNAVGRVIGMNTAASVGFQFQAAREGFALAINRARSLVRQIEAQRSSATVHIGSTPFLGVSVSFADDTGATGGVVGTVVSGSPADQAGIVAGDTIVAVDGQTVDSYAALSKLLLQHNAGDTVTVQWADTAGGTQTVSVKTVAGPPQ